MELVDVEFNYEDLINLKTDEVVQLLKDYVGQHKGDDYYPQTIKDCIENLCDEGSFELDTGYINMRTTVKGCDEYLRDEIFEQNIKQGFYERRSNKCIQ